MSLCFLVVVGFSYRISGETRVVFVVFWETTFAFSVRRFGACFGLPEFVRHSEDKSDGLLPAWGKHTGRIIDVRLFPVWETLIRSAGWWTGQHGHAVLPSRR
jgi:hypothetical protein